MNLTQEKWNYYKTHPVDAARDLLGLKLHWTQRQMIKAAFRSTSCLWLASRSLGKTWLIAVYLCLRCIFAKGFKCGVFSSSYEQSCFTFEKLQQLYETSSFLRSVTEGPPKVTKDGAEFKFVTKSVIQSFPVRRGARFHQVVIDEFRDVSPETITIIKPYLLAKHPTEKNHMLIASTSTYTTNHFYTKYKEFEEEIKKGNPEYAMTIFDIDDALSGDFTFIDKNIVDSIKNELLPEQIDQELYCRFTNLRDGFFPGQLILDCERDYKPEFVCNESLVYLGLDIGRVKGGDNSAFTLCKIVPGEGIKLIRLVTLNGETIENQRKIVGRLVRDYNVHKIIMDNEKLGYALRDSMAKPILDEETNEVLPPLVLEDDYESEDAIRIVKGVNFANKTDIWQRSWEVKMAMQKRMLFFPKDKYRICLNKHELASMNDDERSLVDAYHEIAALKREMSNMELKQNENSSSLSLVPGSGTKIKDDRFWSLVLSASEAIVDYKDMLSVDTSGPTIYWG
jgi:hypothetical protein